MKKEFSFQYDFFNSIDELEAAQVQVIKAAEEACQKAYAPYSNFKVGAAILLEDGQILYGSNQENKAYPSGLCAERVVLFNYGAQQPNAPIRYLAIVGDGKLLEDGQIFSPCGACRQVMAEYASLQPENYKIILKNANDSVLIFNSIDHLLPFIFGNEQK